MKIIHQYKLLKSNVTIDFYNQEQHNYFVDMMKDSKVEIIKLI